MTEYYNVKGKAVETEGEIASERNIMDSEKEIRDYISTEFTIACYLEWINDKMFIKQTSDDVDVWSLLDATQRGTLQTYLDGL